MAPKAFSARFPVRQFPVKSVEEQVDEKKPKDIIVQDVELNVNDEVDEKKQIHGMNHEDVPIEDDEIVHQTLRIVPRKAVARPAVVVKSSTKGTSRQCKNSDFHPLSKPMTIIEKSNKEFTCFQITGNRECNFKGCSKCLNFIMEREEMCPECNTKWDNVPDSLLSKVKKDKIKGSKVIMSLDGIPIAIIKLFRSFDLAHKGICEIRINLDEISKAESQFKLGNMFSSFPDDLVKRRFEEEKKLRSLKAEIISVMGPTGSVRENNFNIRCSVCGHHLREPTKDDKCEKDTLVCTNNACKKSSCNKCFTVHHGKCVNRDDIFQCQYCEMLTQYDVENTGTIFCMGCSKILLIESGEVPKIFDTISDIELSLIKNAEPKTDITKKFNKAFERNIKILSDEMDNHMKMEQKVSSDAYKSALELQKVARLSCDAILSKMKASLISLYKNSEILHEFYYYLDACRDDESIVEWFNAINSKYPKSKSKDFVMYFDVKTYLFVIPKNITRKASGEDNDGGDDAIQEEN